MCGRYGYRAGIIRTHSGSRTFNGRFPAVAYAAAQPGRTGHPHTLGFITCRNPLAFADRNLNAWRKTSLCPPSHGRHHQSRDFR